MSTINGIGTKFYGISEPDNEGNITVTNWFVFFYFPVFPIWRAKIKRLVTNPIEFRFDFISKTPLNIKEILITYLWGLLIMPVAIFGPLILCIKEIQDYIGIIETDNTGFGIYEVMIMIAIAYMLIFIWKWKDWDERRGLPKNYKEILKGKQKIN